jgi:NAD(P)-dependent dehydrogenase (short-subunit alcohol dehydrogenase family)
MPTALVTGANRGIGLELCRQLMGRGHQVIAVCRTSTDDLSALGCRVESGVDVRSDPDLTSLVERLGDTPIDLLVNNAGILTRETLEDLDFDRIREQLEVNSLGPLRTTAALAPQLVDGAKVAIVTSRMGSISDNSSGGMYGYRMSKAAVNIAGVSLANDLRARNIAVILLHPGYVSTEMTKYGGNVEPTEAAKGLLERIDALTMETTGTLWHANGERLDW